jgi:hypothetical protein
VTCFYCHGCKHNLQKVCDRCNVPLHTLPFCVNLYYCFCPCLPGTRCNCRPCGPQCTRKRCQCPKQCPH